MPGRDQTGPNGDGPNGRGLGPCRDETVSESRGAAFFGGRRGRGRRGGWWGNFRRPWAGQGRTQESLEAEESFLKKRLAEVQENLKK